VLAAVVSLVPDALGRTSAIILDNITIRIYDSAGVTASDRSAALKTAGAILCARRSRRHLDRLHPARDGRPSRAATRHRRRTSSWCA
jgi:hypothetical protein